ncbi:MAG: hypothetical protein ACTSWR_00745 [Candidatus Helarchaeota archaeon]
MESLSILAIDPGTQNNLGLAYFRVYENNNDTIFELSKIFQFPIKKILDEYKTDVSYIPLQIYQRDYHLISVIASILSYDFDIIVMEKFVPYKSLKQKGAFRIPELLGIIKTISHFFRKLYIEYHPSTVRRIVFNNGKISKKEAQDIILKNLKLDTEKLPHVGKKLQTDCIDAVILGLAFLLDNSKIENDQLFINIRVADDFYE